MKEFIKSILGDRKKLSILAILVIAGALVLTVFVAQKQQEIRQRAAGEQTAFFFSTGDGCSSPVTTATFGISTTTTLSLCLNTNNTGVSIVNGFDVTIAKGTGVAFTGISDGVDGVKLTTSAFNTVNSDGTIRYSKVDLNNTISGTALYLGKITLTTASTGTGNISMTKAQVITPTSTAALSVAQPTLPYTIAVTNTPTPTVAAKAPPCNIPASILTQLGLPTSTVRGYGDVDLDGDVDMNDSLLILRFVAQLDTPTPVQIEVGDVDTTWGILSGSTSISSVDSLMVQRYLANLPIPSQYNPPNSNTISLPVCLGQTSNPTPTPTITSNITPTPTTTASCPNGNLVFDSKSSSFLALAGQHTLTWPHVVGTASNRILVVGVNLRTSSGGLISSVKYNGIPLTRIGEETYATGVRMSNSIWYLLNPPSGEHDISVTADRSITIGGGATSWSNVNQSAPIGSAITNMAVNGSPTVTGNGSTCGMVVDNLATNTTCSFSPNTEQIERWNRSIPGDDLSDHAGFGQTAGSSMPSTENVTMSWRGTGGNGCSGNWILKAIPLIANGTNPFPTVTPTPTVTPIPDCNGGGTCTACLSDQSNTCNGSGKQSCTYTLYNGDSVCNRVTSQVTCNTAPPNCLSNFTCSASKECVPNPTATPTFTPVPTQGVTPGVTNVPTVSPTPGQTGTTQIALNIGLDSIGSVGDSTNPDPSASTQNPQHPTRNVAVELYNRSETLVSTFNGTVQYNSTIGRFTGTVGLAQTASGNYIVKVKSLGYLKRRIPGITSLVAGQTHNATQVNLVTGDLNGDNRMDIADYNILNDCIFAPASTHGAVCGQNPDYATMSDLNDNGVKNILDYSLFVRELIVRDGD